MQSSAAIKIHILYWSSLCKRSHLEVQKEDFKITGPKMDIREMDSEVVKRTDQAQKGQHDRLWCYPVMTIQVLS
jgi:hypothetical protein